MRSWPKHAAVAAVALVIALLGVELLLRVLKLAPTTGVFTVTESQFRAVPGIFAPGQRLVERSIPALPYRVTIDSLGFRGAELARAKPAGEVRVLMIGDSFTFGDYVADDETLPAQLEAALRAGCPGARVVNAGLGGSTIPDQERMLHRALPLAPDFVVVVFSENDIADLMGATMWERLAQNRAAKSRFPLSVAYPVLRRMALWNLVQRARAGMFTRRVQARAAGEDGGIDPAARDSARARYRRHLLAVRDTLAARGLPLAFVVYPGHAAVGGSGGTHVTDWAAAMAREASIPTYELLPALRASRLPTTTLYLLPHDGHPSARGHALAAASLAERLLATDVLRGACSGSATRVARGRRADPGGNA